MEVSLCGRDKGFIGDVVVDLGIEACICVCWTDKVRKSRGNRWAKSQDNNVVLKNTDPVRDCLVEMPAQQLTSYSTRGKLLTLPVPSLRCFVVVFFFQNKYHDSIYPQRAVYLPFPGCLVSKSISGS